MNKVNIKEINNGDKLKQGVDSFDDLPNYFNKGEDIIIIGKKDRTNFFQGDSVEFYRENLKKMPDDWYYRRNKITYNTNSYGYRTKEFDQLSWTDSIVMFGCSNIFGVGVDEEDTLPANLSRLFDREVINMGVPAGSNELMLYNSLMMKKKYGTPWAIVFSWSAYQRSTYFSEWNVKHIGPWNYKNKNDYFPANEIYENLNFHWTNAPIKTYYTLMLAKELWQKETKFYSISHFSSTSEYGKIDHLPIIHEARDLVHPGRTSNRLNAEIIYNKIK